MPNYSFHKDFPISQLTEKEISEKFLSFYNWKTVLISRTNRYDLLLEKDGRKETIEIKEDFSCQKTGNIGLEFRCRNKPSGISVSKATYYLFKVHVSDKLIEYYLVETRKLKKMVDDRLYHRVVNGGDRGSNSMNYLFKLDVLKNNAKKLFV